MKRKVNIKKPTSKPKYQPLVSFCISTYQRQSFITSMIREVLKQEYPNFEVVICDNDPKGSSRSAVKKFKSSKIKYHVNPKNLGMVKSFNRAFELSKGDFIVFMSDDDPPYPFMLKELIPLTAKYPECGAYFAAYDLFTPETDLAETIQMPQGKLSCRNFDWPKKAIKIFEPSEYLKKALKGEIFYYLMWSTGLVRRELVKKVKAIPAYGSALMTDRSYCLKVGAFDKTLIYNREVAIQTVHQQSFSLTSADENILTKGFVGYYRDIQPYLKGHNLETENQNFVIRHVLNIFLIIKVGDEIRHTQTDVVFLLSVFDKMSQELPFLKPYRWKLRVMLWRRMPFEALFKAMEMSPNTLYKTGIRFIKQRVLKKTL